MSTPMLLPVIEGRKARETPPAPSPHARLTRGDNAGSGNWHPNGWHRHDT